MSEHDAEPIVDAETGEIVDDEDIPFETENGDEPSAGAEPSTALDIVDGDLVSVVGAVGLEEALERVEQYATALTDFVKAHELTLEMEDGTPYLLSPAWEALGQLTGYYALVEWTKPIQNGWEARAIVHKPSTTDAAELLTYTARHGICTRAEFGRDRKPEHELHAMAQTRACRNALRACLSIIPNSAGFDSTPMEERPASPRQRAMLFAILNRMNRLQPRGRDGWKNEVTKRTEKQFGKRISGLTREQMRRVIERMQQEADELAGTPKAERSSFEPSEAEIADAERIAF